MVFSNELHSTFTAMRSQTLLSHHVYLVAALLDPECGEKYFFSHTTFKDVKHRLLSHRSYFSVKLSLQTEDACASPTGKECFT